MLDSFAVLARTRSGPTRKSLAVATLLALLGLAVRVHAAAQPLAGLNAYVRQAMAQWGVPGLAVAVVKDGRVVLARGYGVRELGKPQRVDADTLFTIGSNTKAFTAAALGTLVSAGKLTWNAPVAEHLPGFRLESPSLTEQITLTDLLAHRSGYCDPSSMWYTSRDSVANLLRRLRYQHPRYGFRAHFCYDNVMYLVAAQFIPAITGMSWNRYVAAHLLAPLAMTRTVTSTVALKRARDVAQPHGRVHGRIEVIPRYWAHNLDVFAPVGDINSSVNDMSHWLLMLLADGRYHGRQVLDPAVITAMETPQEPIQRDADLAGLLRTMTPHAHFYAYGRGFLLEDYGGHKLVWHAGDIDGMSSAVALVPGARLGVVVLSNLNENGARAGVMFHVLQSYLGLPHRDVSAALYRAKQRDRRTEQALEARLAASRRPGSRPPLALGAYTGTFTDDFLGTARVSEVHGRLEIALGNPMFSGPLKPWHDNTFRVRWRGPYGTDYVTFDVDALGEPVRLAIAELAVHYERAAPSAPVGGDH